MASTVLSGGRRRSRTARPLHGAIALLALTCVALLATFAIWVAISLGADVIGNWMLLPIALAIAAVMRRRLRTSR